MSAKTETETPANSEEKEKGYVKNGASFQPGKSGNPTGRPKKTAEEFELIAACKHKAPEALEVMANLMRTSGQDSVKLNAALAIVERGFGKSVDRKEIRTGALDAIPQDDLELLNDALAEIRISSGKTIADVAGSTGRTRH